MKATVSEKGQVTIPPTLRETLGVAPGDVLDVAALTAAAAWRSYRRAGGTRTRTRTRITADFLIAAHAQTHADRLLTRDRGFVRTQFTALHVLDPTAA